MFERRSIWYFRNCDVRNRSFVIFAYLGAKIQIFENKIQAISQKEKLKIQSSLRSQF